MPPTGEAALRVVARRTAILRADGVALHAARGREVLRSGDGGATWEPDGRLEGLPHWRRVSLASPTAARISRSGITSLILLSDGARLAVSGGILWRAPSGLGTYRPVHRFDRGSRPLGICLTPGGELYWGEYFLNLRRAEPVRIFRSADGGLSWQTAWTFPPGEICHVHRIVHDPFDDSLLVLTGDRDAEAGIRRTRDRFRSLELAAGGSQQFRAAAMVPTPAGLLFGTDSPRGQNRIMLLERSEGPGAPTALADVPGPVIHGCRVGRGWAFSTMVECPGHRAEVWYGDDAGCRRVASFPARPGSWLRREVLGYPSIRLPDGPCGTAAWCTPEGTDRHDGDLLELGI
jgi:hypothetical protein